MIKNKNKFKVIISHSAISLHSAMPPTQKSSYAQRHTLLWGRLYPAPSQSTSTSPRSTAGFSPDFGNCFQSLLVDLTLINTIHASAQAVLCHSKFACSSPAFHCTEIQTICDTVESWEDTLQTWLRLVVATPQSSYWTFPSYALVSRDRLNLGKLNLKAAARGEWKKK